MTHPTLDRLLLDTMIQLTNKLRDLEAEICQLRGILLTREDQRLRVLNKEQTKEQTSVQTY